MPLLIKKFRPFQTSADWEFKDPDTGRVHKTATQEELIKLIVSYRAQNGLDEIENLNLVLENYLCNMPLNEGKCSSFFPLKRGFIATVKGGVALLKSMMYKSFVSQEVADGRSNICRTCPYNVFPDKGPFIKWSDTVAEGAVGNRKSKYHDELGNCEVCTCPLRAKVFYDGEIKLPDDQQEVMRKVGCWQVS